jgi:nitroreductase
MIASATTAPSAVDTQPWNFLVVDTDEAKAKLDSIMHMPVDRGRLLQSSFSVVIFADTHWVEDLMKSWRQT